MTRKSLKKLFKNLRQNEAGFSLTEVLIGVSILTVAVVTGTQMLVSFISSNQRLVDTTKAHYLAMEGIEAVRNIRDSNWLFNQNWLGDDDAARTIWHGSLELDDEQTFDIQLLDKFFEPASPSVNNTKPLNLMAQAAPWKIENVSSSFRDIPSTMYNFISSQNRADAELISPEMRREITLSEYECDNGGDCSGFVKVTSKVIWGSGLSEREYELEAILTNWKGINF